MKIKRLWLVLVSVMITANAPLAADYVPPRVVPSNYVSDFGVLQDFPGLADYTFLNEWITYYTYGWDAGREIFWIYPDWNGQYLEQIVHMQWSNPTWPEATGLSAWQETWWGEDYSSGSASGPSELSFLFQLARVSYNYSTNMGGSNGTVAVWNNTDTQAALLTGGVPDVAATRFFKLTASALNVLSNNAVIPKTSLSIGGIPCDTDGCIYGLLDDNDGLDVTVRAQGVSSALGTNYTYSVTPEKARLAITRGGDITDQTNTVIVGEQIALTCQFLNATGSVASSIAPITNFQWTVPGSTVSNYVPSTPASLLHSDLNTTNGSIYFYWYRPGTDLEVQCTAIAKGVTMTAKSKFNVIAPDFIGIICRSNFFKCDTNYLEGTNGIFLHLGDGTGPPGIVFQANGSGSATSLVESNYSIEFLQTTSFEAHQWHSNGTHKVLNMTNVLDDPFPYESTRTNDLIWSRDNPSLTAGAGTIGLSDSSSFDLFLMYQSSRPNSIWVPLLKNTWSYSAAATNISGAWSVTVSNVSPIDCSWASGNSPFPWWTNTVTALKTNWKTL